MAEKKKETKKTDAKKVAPTKAKAPIRAQSNVKAKAPVKQEEVYPAIHIANTYGIPSFDFYMVKEAKGINDDTLLTIREFQGYLREVIRR